MTWWIYLLGGAATWGLVLAARKQRGQKSSALDMVIPLLAWPLLWVAVLAWTAADMVESMRAKR